MTPVLQVVHGAIAHFLLGQANNVTIKLIQPSFWKRIRRQSDEYHDAALVLCLVEHFIALRGLL